MKKKRITKQWLYQWICGVLACLLLAQMPISAYAEETNSTGITAPQSPKALTATSYGSSIVLQWQAVESDSPVFYMVAEEVDGKIADLSMDDFYHQTQFELQAREAGDYRFAVRAYSMDDGKRLYSDYTKTVEVSVQATFQTISVSQKYITLGIGETASLTTQTVLAQWYSSDESVLSVSQAGKVTAKKEGQAIVTAKTKALLGEGAVSCVVTVKEAPQKLQLQQDTEIGLGTTLSIVPDMGAEQAGGTISYQLSDTTKAVVTKTGELIPLQFGTVELTAASFNGMTDTTTITIKKAPTEIAFSKEAYRLGNGETVGLKIVLDEEFAANYTVATADDSVATVNQDGKLESTGVGKTTVTVTTYNGITATSTVEVLAAPDSISIAKQKQTLKLGESVAMKATLPEGSYSSKLKYTSSDEQVAAVDQHGNIVAQAAGTATVTVEAFNGVSASMTITVKKAKNYDKMIALTFDDGPSRATTTKLLDALKERGITATFFMLGNRVAGNEDIVKRIANEGHELGNHSWDHSYLTADNTETQLGKTDDALIDACGKASTVFRAPYGSYDNSVLQAARKPQIYWSVDTLDWKYKDTEYVTKTLLENAEDGEIILFHDIHETSVDGVIAALDELIKEGYHMVTATELLSRNGNPPKAGNTYFSEPKK